MCGLRGDFVGVDVDDFDYPIGIGAAGGGDDVGDGLAADFYRSRQDVRFVREDIGAAGGFALVVYQPDRPGIARAVAHGHDWGADDRGLAWRDRRRIRRRRRRLLWAR